MKVCCLAVGQLATNCYLAVDEKTRKAIIIDPGDDGGFIIQKILDLRLEPVSIVATHGHFDHVLAATELKLAFSIPFFLHHKDEPILKRSQKTAGYFTGLSADPPPKIDQFLEEGDCLEFGKEKLFVIETPGHTPGGICLCDRKQILFSGDTLFADGQVGRTDFGGSEKELSFSIKDKLLVLPGVTIVYPGHGRQTTIGEEKENLLKSGLHGFLDRYP